MAGLNKRIGIFGGTFDPPHLGHLILAEESLDQLRLDRLYWVLTPDPPHKRAKRLTPIEIRFLLVNAAIRNNKSFQFSRADMDRPGPHFALDTVKIIKNQNPSAAIFYLIGGDSLHDFPNWYHPQELLDHLSGLGVMRRPGDKVNLDQLEKALPGIINKLIFIDAPLLEIASNEIRKRICFKKPYRYYLPDSVYKIIKKNNYYSENLPDE
jgi:nicotinate-nucleotide adenylyltransferase